MSTEDDDDTRAFKERFSVLEETASYMSPLAKINYRFQDLRDSIYATLLTGRQQAGKEDKQDPNTADTGEPRGPKDG